MFHQNGFKLKINFTERLTLPFNIIQKVSNKLLELNLSFFINYFQYQFVDTCHNIIEKELIDKSIPKELIQSNNLAMIK